MKLYATTTSERASKGQGGNEYLDIVVTDEAGNERLIVKMRVLDDMVQVRTSGVFVKHCTFILPEQKKGKKQKGE